MKRSLALALTSLAFTVCAFGADRREPVRQSVKIIDRHYSEAAYSYCVPEHGEATSNGSFGCFGSGGNINCSGSQNSSAYAVGASMTAYSVSGATLALLLPDGRVAVVNCSSKYSPKFDYINRRSCRFPLVDNIEAEFHGNKAKLVWQVSLDGKKIESETYNIVAVVGTADSSAAHLQPHSQKELNEYAAIVAANKNPAAQENAANAFAAEFPDSELRPFVYKSAMHGYQRPTTATKWWRWQIKS